MDYYMIGQKIRKYRKAIKLSQEQLAEIVNISVTHMSHIETGNTKLSLPVLVELSKALNVTTDDLLFDDIIDKKKSLSELIDVIDSCSQNELKIILDTVKTMKTSFDKYL